MPQPSTMQRVLIAACVAASLAGSALAFTPVSLSSSSINNRVLGTTSPSLLRSSSTAENLECTVQNQEQQQKPTQAVQQQQKQQKSWNDDGFVFGLDGSGLERPTGRTSQIVVEGDSLETQLYQQAIVAVTMAGHATFAALALSQMLEWNDGNVLLTSAQAVSLALSSWVLADFGSGVLHWSVDNYGNGKTPVMGSIIAAFQGHHAAPWTITERGFCNNVYKLCIPFGLVPMTLVNAITGPFATFFWTTFCVLEILSQEFHKWSHQLPSETPDWVNQMQALGVSVGRKPHAMHHLAPYEGNYCIISGFCNEWLDESGFFRRLEHAVYKWNGVESNAWKLDPALRERTLAGDYSLPPPVVKKSSLSQEGKVLVAKRK